ncbi:hypothetical protein GGE24_005577 [Bradyrhizobium centrosematis]|nr:hypothetical protein [Bradyrhizobium centrosematis]MCS3776221.1 hypothetical protein [Bradyrhizobium centrosematis]
MHATTQCVVNEAFATEKPHLGPLPLASFRSVLKLERRVSHEGMVSVGGNLYSVPDATRKRIVEVHTLANEMQIFEDGTLIATHPILDGRRQRRIAPRHRKMPRLCPSGIADTNAKDVARKLSWPHNRAADVRRWPRGCQYHLPRLVETGMRGNQHGDGSNCAALAR